MTARKTGFFGQKEKETENRKGGVGSSGGGLSRKAESKREKRRKLVGCYSTRSKGPFGAANPHDRRSLRREGSITVSNSLPLKIPEFSSKTQTLEDLASEVLLFRCLFSFPLCFMFTEDFLFFFCL